MKFEKNIFIDTGAYLALFHKQDRHHQECCKFWEKIDNSNCIPITTNHVIDELATLLARRTDYNFAYRKLHEIYASEYPIIYRPDRDDELKALESFGKYADQKVSFTDCLSFAVINKLKIEQIFSFDKHFSIGSFQVFPSIKLP